MVKVVESLSEFYKILYAGAMFLSSDEKGRVRHHVLRFGRHYRRCASDAAAQGRLLFQCTPKLHWFQHIPQQCELTNLRFLQNYAEESFMQVLSQMYMGVKNGP